MAGVRSFGTADLKQTKVLSVQIENVGGEKTFVRAEVLPPLQIESGDVAFTLQAREKKDLRIGIRPDSPGKFRA